MLVNAGTSGAHAPSGLVYHDSTLTRLYAHEPKTGFVSDRIRADSGRGLRYTYDARNQLWKVQTYTVANAATLCNGVDSLTGEISTQCVRQNVASQHTFTYDIHGNRTDLSAVNMFNNRQTAIDGMKFSYDYDGNLTEKKLKDGRFLRFAWSADNQLTGITRYATDSTTVQEVFTYTYDGFGRRIRKSSSVGKHRLTGIPP